MKQADLKEKSSLLVIGKGIIVLVLTAIASLSFLLGFYVGNIGRPPEPSQPPFAAEQGNTEANTPVSQDQQALPQQDEPLHQTGESQTPPDADALKPIQAVSDTHRALQLQTPQQPGEPEKSDLNSRDRKNQAPPAAAEQKKTEEAHGNDKAKKYTVQVGAFRNTSDAGAFRAKLDKKGYKTFLIELKAKNIEPIYKVTVGTFSTRNEAELFAARMKKSEALKAFVTLR
jgi:cell division septation protein DedD